MLDATVKTLLVQCSKLEFSIHHLIVIFKSIWHNGLHMQSLEFNHSRNCREVVESAEWRSSGLPQVPAAPDKNWLLMEKTLAEVGILGSESNDFSRVMFVGRGMAGKSRLVKALKSPSVPRCCPFCLLQRTVAALTPWSKTAPVSESRTVLIASMSSMIACTC